MQISARHADPLNHKCDCLIVGVKESGKQDPSVAAIDKATGGVITRCLNEGDLSGKVASSLMLHEPKGLAASRLLLIGIGAGELGIEQFLKVARAAARSSSGKAIKNAATTLGQAPVTGQATGWAAAQLSRLFTEAGYSFRKGENETPKSEMKKLVLLSADRNALKSDKAGIDKGSAIGAGVNRCRYLGDLPANTCTPSYLATQARALGRKHERINTRVLSEKQMRELGMGALLSVTAGTQEPAHLIAMEYRGAAKTIKPVVLVGKGVTFDSGGISLKPGAKMDEMKYDMCGAASVFGVMEVLAQLQPKLNVIGLVPAVENLPSGRATKPGDVVTSMSGKTIEILNTDAEGRLILCDALTYAERYKPETVIDIATLTGACIMALGHISTGLFANDQSLADELMSAGQTAGDRAWQLPIWDDYDEQLKSNFADIPNIGGAGAGSITAACFLGRFTKDYRWAHLDIAGTAWNSAAPKGATGRPVPLLIEYLLTQTN